MKFEIVDSWNSYLNRIPSEKKDIYYTEEYTRLYESDADRSLCVVGEGDGNIILMPFALKLDDISAACLFEIIMISRRHTDMEARYPTQILIYGLLKLCMRCIISSKMQDIFVVSFDFIRYYRMRCLVRNVSMLFMIVKLLP